MIRKNTAALLCVLLTLLIPQNAYAAVTPDLPTRQITYREDNIEGNHYDYFNSVNRSFFRKAAGGYMRLYGADNGTVFVEYYNEDFNCVNSGVIPSGLPIFGGFYEDDSRYYVLTGQTNMEEDPDKEVYRLTKFDKNWNQLGSVGIKNACTTIPFQGGCDFAMYNKHLVVRTGRQMYQEDGLYHQSNITLRFDVSTMTEEPSVYGASILALTGYASNSFNQFVAIDDGYAVCLDHVDANPRVALLGKFNRKTDTDFLDGNTVNYDSISIIKYKGDGGDNTTGANIGGLAISSTAYLTVGDTFDQSNDSPPEESRNVNLSVDDTVKPTESVPPDDSRNVYLSVTPKDPFDEESTKRIWFSDYVEEDHQCATNPHLVKINDDRFLIMWDERNGARVESGGKVIYDSSPTTMKYVFVDGNGNIDPAQTEETDIHAVGDPRYQIRSAPKDMMIFVSGDQPIVTEKGVIWHFSNEDTIDAVALMDFDGNITLHKDIIPKDVFTYPVNMYTATTVLKTFDPIPESLTLTEDNLFDYIGVYKDGHELKCGEDFNFRYDGEPLYSADYENGYLKRIGPHIETAYGKSYIGVYGITSKFYPYTFACGTNVFATFNQNGGDTPTWTDDGVRLCYTFTRGVGYHIYRKENGGEYEKIATFTNRGGTEYIDTTAQRDKHYWYTAREYTFDKDGNEILSEPLNAKTPDSPTVTAQPTFDGFRLSWDAMDGAEKYAVYEYDIERDRIKYPALGITTDCHFELRATGYGVEKRYAVVAVDPTQEELNIPDNCRYSAYGLTPTLTLNNIPEITRCDFREDGLYIEWAPNEFADHYTVVYDRAYNSIKENHLLIRNVYNNDQMALYVVAEKSGCKSIQAPTQYVTYVAPGTDDWSFHTQCYSAQSGMATFTGWHGDSDRVTVPGDVLGVSEVMMSRTFRDNTRIKSVILPENTSMLDGAFEGCTALQSITIPGSASFFGKCFAGCTSLKSVVFERDFSISNLPDHTFDGCGDITIYGYSSQYGACDIAKQFGFTYVDLDQCLPGDADASGVVDLMDATAIQRHLANLNVSVENAILMLGDIDSSGALEVSDATYIQRKITEIDVPNVIGLINSR